MKAKDIMSSPPVTVSPEEKLWAVKRIFEKHHFHHVLVVEQGKLTGVMSDRDYLKSVSPNVKNGALTSTDLNNMNRKVHQIMSHKLVTIKPDDQVMTAVMLFNEHKISCLPVVDGEKAVGIVSWRDVMRFLQDRVLAKKSS
jgi:acetoin utilization protein AcuB